MKKSVFIMLSAVIISVVSCKEDPGLGEEDAASYIKHYGTAAKGADLQETDDGGFILLGTVQGAQSEDVLLIKTDKFGNRQWAKSFDIQDVSAADSLDEPIISNEIAHTIHIVDGEYVISGTANKYFNESFDPPTASFLLRVDGGGFLVRYKTFGDDESLSPVPRNENGYGFTVLDNGNFVLASERDEGAFNVGIGREIDANSMTVVYQQIADQDGGDANKNVGFRDVIQRANGKIVFVGYNNLATSDNVLAFYETSSLASSFSDAALNAGIDNLDVIGYSLIEDMNSDLVSSGVQANFNTPGLPIGQLFIMKGRKISEIQVETVWATIATNEIPGNSAGLDVIQTSDGGYVAAGVVNITGDPNEQQLLIAKYDDAGTMEWYRNYGYVGFDYASAIVETSDGKLAICGTCEDERGNQTMCLIKTNANGELE